MDKDYYLGLDIGTDSVGWALTDSDYNLLRLKGKTAWGARIFDSAKDSKERRGFRSNRRRTQRRNYRVNLINNLFFDELSKIDETFLLRLKESNLVLEDKSNKEFKYPLFKEKDLEKEFYKKYPTIYHLRRDQYLNKDEAFKDIRYLYLTVHHIIKYRGNFLKKGEINLKKFDYSILDNINVIMNNLYLSSFEEDEEPESITFLEKDKYQDFINCLLDKHTNKTEKKKIINELIYPFKESKKMKLINDKLFKTLLVSGSVDIKELVEQDETVKFEFNDTFEQTLSSYQGSLGKLYEVIVDIKNIYDYVYISKLIGDNDTLSEAYVAIYNEHKKDLRILKDLLIKVDNKLGLNGKERYYYQVFKKVAESSKKDDQIDNYQRFIKENYSGKHATLNEFNTFLSKLFKEESFKAAAETLPNYQYLVDKCNDKETSLLARVSDVSNSSIPHQLHLEELRKILNNAKKHFFNFVNDELINKIVTLFKFRVPYFVGPLSKNDNAYSNIVRNSNENITPFNFNQVVNLEKTKEKFINQRLNYCSYLFNEFVLPKNSIIYMDYVNLNRLNSLTINNSKISQDVKLDLFNNLIKRNFKTTINGIAKYLKNHYEVYAKDGVSISGINSNDDFNSTSRTMLYKIFEIDVDKEELDLDLCEDIIKIMTIYKDAREDGAEFIHKKYPNLSKNVIRKISSLNFSGWGRLSKKLLTGIYNVDQNGEIGNETILEVLYNTTLNFEQVLHNEKYNFLVAIDNYNDYLRGESSKTNEEFINEKIESIPALMRRSVIQSLGIINEIRQITKKDPSKITIEVTRKDDIKKETISRRKELQNFLDSIIKDKKVSDYFKSKATNIKEELDEKIKDDKALKGKHLYLYVKQLGIDLYTGKQMNIEGVLNGEYDLDHIIPKSLKPGDDSLDNLVLVSKEANQKVKRDIYPIVPVIRKNKDVIACWKFLHSKGMISKEKYYRLTRDTELSEDELSDFITRQINVVNFSNVVLKDILKILLPNTEVIFSKSTYPSYAREVLQVPKIRDLNDTHHAVDAYLNVVTGTLLMKRFGDMRLIKAKKDQEERIKRGEVIETKEKISFNLKEYLNYKFRTLGEKVKNNCLRHDMLLTFKLSYGDDHYYKQTIFKKGESSLIPIHTKNNSPFIDTNKYGGYSSLTSEYMIVATNKKKNRKEIVTVPHLFIDSYKDEETLTQKLKEFYGLGDEYTLDLNDKIFNNTKIICDGCAYLINTANETRIKLKLASNIFLSYKNLIKLHKLLTLEKRIDIDTKDRDEISFYTDKNNTNSIKISKKDNCDIVSEFIEISLQKRFDFYNRRVCQLRNYDLSKFLQKDIREQLKEIKDIMYIFSRANGFLLSKTKVFEYNIKIQYDSITGLYSKVI